MPNDTSDGKLELDHPKVRKLLTNEVDYANLQNLSKSDPTSPRHTVNSKGAKTQINFTNLQD